MNILAFSQSADILGGANRSFLDVLVSLSKNYNHKCVVVVPSTGEFSQKLEELGFEYMVYPYYQTSFVLKHDIYDSYRYVNSVIRFIKNKIRTRSFCKQIKSLPIDVVYINDTTNTFGYLISSKLRIPFVWHFRGYQYAIKHYMPCERSLRSNPLGVFIYTSKAMAEYMINVRKLNSKDSVVVYGGVKNPAPIDSKSNIRTQPNEELHCLHCGHISEAKGVLDSLYAMVELKNRGYKNIVLHYAGTPAILRGISYKEKLSQIIKENNLSNNVIFEGEVKDMTSLRKNMDIELICSIAEPFGRTTVEGMQSGLVIIGADSGATPEIIQDGINGLLYNQGHPEDLSEKIIQLHNNPSLLSKLSLAGIEYTKHSFTIEKNVDEINEVLITASNK